VRVETLAAPPQVELDVFASSRPAGALKGAAIMGGVALAATGIAYAASPQDGWARMEALAIGALTTGAFTVVGGIQGALAALPARTARDVERSLRAGVARAGVQESLGESLRRSLAPVGLEGEASSVLEIGARLVEAQCVREPATFMRFFEGCDDPLRFALVVTAEARLLRAKDRQELHRRHLQSVSTARPAQEWLDADGSAFAAGLAIAIDDLARQARGEVFPEPPR
jgi:hypothetical protein